MHNADYLLNIYILVMCWPLGALCTGAETTGLANERRMVRKVDLESCILETLKLHGLIGVLTGKSAGL